MLSISNMLTESSQSWIWRVALLGYNIISHILRLTKWNIHTLSLYPRFSFCIKYVWIVLQTTALHYRSQHCLAWDVPSHTMKVYLTIKDLCFSLISWWLQKSNVILLDTGICFLILSLVKNTVAVLILWLDKKVLDLPIYLEHYKSQIIIISILLIIFLSVPRSVPFLGFELHFKSFSSCYSSFQSVFLVNEFHFSSACHKQGDVG